MKIAIIPARGGSKRIPRKNIKELNGKPLIGYTIENVKKSNLFDKVIVSTDDEEIKNISIAHGAEVPFLRPKTISGDKSNDYEFVNHALDWFSTEEGIIPSYIVQLRPTSPLRDPKLIDKAIREFKKSKRATALRSVHPMSESAYKCFEIDEKYLACLCTRSQDIESKNLSRHLFPKTYEPNSYVDILKTEFIIKTRKIHGDKVLAFHSPRVIDINNQEDFDFVTFQTTQKKDLTKKYFHSYKPVSL